MAVAKDMNLADEKAVVMDKKMVVRKELKLVDEKAAAMD